MECVLLFNKIMELFDITCRYKLQTEEYLTACKNFTLDLLSL